MCVSDVAIYPRSRVCELAQRQRWREERQVDYSLELDRKPGILSPKARTFSKSQTVNISISDTFMVGNCN